MTITHERKEAVDFSDPYAMAQLAVLANANSGIEEASDLNQAGKKVAAEDGLNGPCVGNEESSQRLIIVRLADESACVTEVVQGKADGFLYDQLTIYRRNLCESPNSHQSGLHLLSRILRHGEAAVKKGDTELLDQSNEFIAQSKEDREFDRLTEKYLAEEKKAFDEYRLQMVLRFRVIRTIPSKGNIDTARLRFVR